MQSINTQMTDYPILSTTTTTSASDILADMVSEYANSVSVMNPAVRPDATRWVEEKDSRIPVGPAREESGIDNLMELLRDCFTFMAKIERIIYQGNKTTILWDDGTHTTVGWMEGDSQPYSRLSGLAMCLLKRHFELPDLSYRETIKHVFPSALFEPEEVKKLLGQMLEQEQITQEEYKWMGKRIPKIEQAYLDIIRKEDCCVEKAIKKAVEQVLNVNCPRKQLAPATAKE